MGLAFCFNRQIMEVESSVSRVKFVVKGALDLPLALYYMDNVPEDREKDIGVEKRFSLPEHKVKRVFRPLFSGDLGYSNYNFVLLNAEVKHKFSDVVRDYSLFLQQRQTQFGSAQPERKVQFLDFDLEILKRLSVLNLLSRANPKNGTFCRWGIDYKLKSEGTAIKTICLYEADMGKGLRHIIGYNSSDRKETNLDERIEF
ncbi:MAG: hypothetical protein AABX11_05025 [Nanoarchaeota archaeon]